MRSGGNSTINPAMMNAQMYDATQAAMRQGQASSPPHSADGRSPMLGAGESQSFPALRSNPSTMPGIARSNRSPSDNAQSPMTPRVPMRVPSAQQMHAQQSQSQDEYHRALLEGQQQAAARSGYINPQQLGQAGWPQQMAMAINQSHGQGQVQSHQGSYGMSPPGSAGPGGPSPTGINPSQTWSQNANHYPYAGSPSASAQQGRAPTPVRGASSTPVPHGSPSGEQSGQESFDLFNWG
ncbi:hypothetical protein JAAARDRAFT_27768 [Jaapia argillacea MUCL 33604]|uniref:Uncharacterized protein n=1 Tax=Jaapia argillacea MUCL 33604 TaxID=933084 RepID=A0A067QAR0_9AGAM|nr:hypothetical protein JAAARDRAFT_27768 [Jaapia argillacea MUCL 33604]